VRPNCILIQGRMDGVTLASIRNQGTSCRMQTDCAVFGLKASFACAMPAACLQPWLQRLVKEVHGHHPDAWRGSVPWVVHLGRGHLLVLLKLLRRS
jgi:hypothetical protein